MALITCKDLCLAYDGKIVLNNLNFHVNSGDYLCIVGENGSGKTTLMHALLGLKSPLHGEVLFEEGLNLKDIGYLPQQTIVQRDFPASVREVVLSGCLNRLGFFPFYSRTEKQIAKTNMDRLGIASLANRCYRELSGGQQQRVLLARALCSAKRLLLLDEPASGLDPRMTQEMYSLISELNQKDQITIIMISHDIAAAVKYASNILHLGKQLFFGSTKEYMESGIGRAYSGNGGCA
ncbi:MAG TPA: ABC transporter ATP-binding protein [Clostridiales bacterium]|nr:ABC transporter ATP-binding protein [Clostridiales bacterium]